MKRLITLLVIMLLHAAAFTQIYSPHVVAHKVQLDSTVTDSLYGSFWLDGTELKVYSGSGWTVVGSGGGGTPGGADTSYFDLVGSRITPKTGITLLTADSLTVGKSGGTSGVFKFVASDGDEAQIYINTSDYLIVDGFTVFQFDGSKAMTGTSSTRTVLGVGAKQGNNSTAIGYNAGSADVNETSIGAYTGLGGGGHGTNLGVSAGRYETQDYKIFIDNIDRTNEANSRAYAPFYSVTNATPSSQVTQIGGTGKVGIGTTSPSEMLHVIGNGLFTGNLSVKDTIEADIIAPDDSTATYFTSDINVANDIYADSLFVNYLGGAIGEIITDTLNVDSLFVNGDLREGAYFLVADGSGNVVSLMDTTGYKGGGGGSSDWTRSGNDIYPTTATDNIWGKDTIFVGENGGTTGALALIDGANMNTIQSYGGVVVIPTPAQGLIMQGRNYTNPGMYYASGSGTAFLRPGWATNSGFGGAASAPEIIVNGTWRVQCDSVARINDVLMIVPRSSAPSNPVEGWIYSNSTDHHLYYYNDSTWVQLDN